MWPMDFRNFSRRFFPRNKMKYIDSHSHLYMPQFDDDREAVIDRMWKQGVGTIVVGVDFDTSQAAIALAKQYPDVVCGATIGIHPTDTDDDFDPAAWEAPAQYPEVVGIGECGLDYFRFGPLDTNERQLRVFTAQIEFAAVHNLPLMLHVRPSQGSDDAHNDAIELLRAAQVCHGEKVRGTAHFFTGSLNAAQKYWDLGFATSFPGVITFAKETEEVVRKCPSELMLSETDAPYAAPVPHRGKRNEPVFVIDVVRKIAGLRGEEEGAVAQQIIQNTQRIFNCV